MPLIEHRFRAMGGPCRLRLDCPDRALAEAAVTAAQSEVRRLEHKYSRYLEDSLTSRINRAAGSGRPVPIDAETAGLLRFADTLWRESEGVFDLTSGVLRRAWDFRSGRLPDAARVRPLLDLVNWASVTWDQQAVALPRAGMELDFGGCVKEYACDAACAVVRRCGVHNGLVDLAGDIAVVGPRLSGEHWQIGISHPQHPQQALATIDLAGGGLASSGDYQRCLLVDGVRYGHILDPRTGWPVRGLVAATVLADQCLVAGSGATVALLKPRDDALAWLEGLGLPWLAVDAQMGCFGTLAVDA